MLEPTEWKFGDHHDLICFPRAAGKFGIERHWAEGFKKVSYVEGVKRLADGPKVHT